MRVLLIHIFLAIFCSACFAQTKDVASPDAPTKKNLLQSVDNLSSKTINSLNDKYSKLTATVEKQSEKLLQRMQQKEAKLKKKIPPTPRFGGAGSKGELIDSVSFQEASEKYKSFLAELQSPANTALKLKEYIPGLDSLQTSLNFLTQDAEGLSSLPTDKLQQLQSLSSKIKDLQTKLQQANDIQSFIREREAKLKEQLMNTGLGKQLTSLNKQVYYYQQRLHEYKELLNDKNKLKDKLLSTVRALPAFQKFWQKNSFLAQLFPMPDNYGTPQALAGLQTRASIQNILSERLSSGGGGASANPQQYFQQQLGEAQSKLNELKNKINQLSGNGGGNSDMTLPNFQPNEEKTKTFFQRIEYGFNIQSEPGTSFLPAMSDIALKLGYKVNDKSRIGVGASYKLGWGSGWNNIRFSNEGVGLRSYVDIKAKGTLWISGGMEYNYLNSFSSIRTISNFDVWQRSALLGVSKKYKMPSLKKGGKGREGNIQLLYDFLHNEQTPPAQGLKFRVGCMF